ncbi:MAG: hypothetical protein GWN76_24405 [candidate division Zixibacteria bacterium]|nr:hypothetical protein [candidate division Zixibacteria bacterium]NIS48979.1 hypothetical protein [candidate division Zixibacteria bacterium]NIU17062.1 hypothetical protein [candidate division Zixibacteria bacterium]NIW97063.1 hypothetical protein [Phycisphaerae bacterium]
MSWDAGLIDRMEKMQVMLAVMQDYYSLDKPSLGKYAQNHSQPQVDLVASILALLGEDDR